MTTPRRALAQMISEAGCHLAVARAILRFQALVGKPWTGTDEEAWKRIAQALRGAADRHFEIDWYPIVLRVVILHGGSDLVEPIIAEARYAARRDSETEELRENRGPYRVRPAQEEGRRRA